MNRTAFVVLVLVCASLQAQITKSTRQTYSHNDTLTTVKLKTSLPLINDGNTYWCVTNDNASGGQPMFYSVGDDTTGTRPVMLLPQEVSPVMKLTTAFLRRWTSTGVCYSRIVGW